MALNQPIPPQGSGIPPVNNIQDYADIQQRIENISKLIDNQVKSQKLSGLEATNLKSTYRDLNKELSKLNTLVSEYNEGLLKTKDINKEIQKTKNNDYILEVKIQKAKSAGNKSLERQLTYEQKINSQIQDRNRELLKENQIIDKKVGLLGNVLTGAKKIPIIGDSLDIDGAIQNMRILAKEGAGSAKLMGSGLSTALAPLSKATIWTFFITEAFKADTQATKLAKTLIQTKEQASITREAFADMSANISDTFINTTKLLEANSKLSKQLGFSKVFSQDLNEEFINITEKIGVSEESAGGLAKMTLATSRSMKQTKIEALGASQAISAQYGVQLDNAQILEEVGKTSGQLLANFKAAPGALASAVAQAKALGTNLQTVKQQGEALLNFESSIENELKAELLTGRELNLERARAASLMGDQKTVMEELTSQNIDYNKFTNMNVIQQKSVAEALGLQTDQLADQLMMQQYIGKSREQIIALGGEEVAQRMQSLSAQQKFQAAMEKLQDLIGNLLSGPLGTLLNVIADIAGVVFKILGPIIEKLRWITNGLSSGINGIIGGVKGTMDDGIAGYGNKALITPQGTYALNNNDSVIAGTKLFKGDDVTTLPKDSLSIGGGADLTPMINAINEVKAAVNALANKPIIVNLDGRKVGDGVYNSIYKTA